MTTTKNIREWRSVEIAKLFLLKQDVNLTIDDSPGDFFDFIVSLKSDSNTRFAVEVKSKFRFKSNINKQIDLLEEYRNQRLITLPVLIIKVDDKKETCELDFLVYPSLKEEMLLVRKKFVFTDLNKNNFKTKLASIKKWYSKIPKIKDRIKEIDRRKITDQDLSRLANVELQKTFKGTAIVGLIKIVNLNESIIKKWKFKSNKSLITLYKIRNYLDFAISKAQTIQMLDYDLATIIEEVEFPSIIQQSDQFTLILPVEDSTNQKNLASIFSLIATSLEMMRISIDNGFAIRGSIDIGNIYFNKKQDLVLGEPLDRLESLKEISESDYKVLLSNRIKALIKQNLNNVNPAMLDYFRRFIYKDDSNYLVINPALILAQTPENQSYYSEKIKSVVSNNGKKATRSKFTSLIKKIKNPDLTLQDLQIFD